VEGRDGLLELQVDIVGAAPEGFRAAFAQGAHHNVWRYADLLPTVDDPLSLDEGGTPLTLLRRASDELGIRLYVKNETVNPTWSFKDRYAAVALSVARRLGYTKVVCASTGSFGQAVAAYAALAGLRCLVLCPPAASELMRRVMRLHGAAVAAMPKGPRETILRRLVAEHGWYPATSADPDPVGNPFGMAGYKSIGYELAGQLGEVPDSVLVPVGGGDCLAGIWQGLRELRAYGLIDRLPRMVGCQTHAAAPLSHALERQLAAIEPLPEGESDAVSIVEGRCGVHVLHAVRESGGTAVVVTERELVDATRLLARHGILPEAASAASLVGALALHRQGAFSPGAAVVCVVTGTGVKWPAVVANLADAGPFLAEPTLEALADLVAL
jgi:threonine synthase